MKQNSCAHYHSRYAVQTGKYLPTFRTSGASIIRQSKRKIQQSGGRYVWSRRNDSTQTKHLRKMCIYSYKETHHHALQLPIKHTPSLLCNLTSIQDTLRSSDSAQLLICCSKEFNFTFQWESTTASIYNLRYERQLNSTNAYGRRTFHCLCSPITHRHRRTLKGSHRTTHSYQ